MASEEESTDDVEEAEIVVSSLRTQLLEAKLLDSHIEGTECDTRDFFADDSTDIGISNDNVCI
jgi:hypothetical protein